MKYRDKTLPTRDGHFWEPKLVGNDTVEMTLCYSVVSKNQETWIRQPVTIGICDMRALGQQFHQLLDELEDRLLEARKQMKGTR